MIRKYLSFAGPVVLITMLSLAVWLFAKAGGSIAFPTSRELTGASMWRHIFAGSALWVVIYGTFMPNSCDSTRSAKSKPCITRGNFFGTLLNMRFFAGIVTVLSGAQFKINGQIIENPQDAVEKIPNTALLAVACTALAVLTIAVSLLANFVAPIHMFTGLMPRTLDFRRTAVLTTVPGIVLLPWNPDDSPTVITYFLGGGSSSTARGQHTDPPRTGTIRGETRHAAEELNHADTRRQREHHGIHDRSDRDHRPRRGSREHRDRRADPTVRRGVGRG